jgi:hypothetical protein
MEIALRNSNIELASFLAASGVKPTAEMPPRLHEAYNGSLSKVLQESQKNKAKTTVLGLVESKPRTWPKALLMLQVSLIERRRMMEEEEPFLF